jgi:hypothetical protein
VEVLRRGGAEVQETGEVIVQMQMWAQKRCRGGGAEVQSGC